MKIKVLYFKDCPNHTPAVERVRRIVSDLRIEAGIEAVEVKPTDDAHRLRFLGSPTVQVNGVDIEPQARDRTDFGFGCRVYGNDGVPPREMIAAAIDEARS